ncbi:hypothetical protein RN346_02715 [Halomonas sp. PAMB 3232]|uniref:hypothetical protein n=1 Tax=Halomonas sp. PAMB 3232 TaxID=3075221 RepID=UPI0028A2D359|nr:hypothetical protein [Halomonas sp. PAMB 3232]WNL39482.1 hypothetical protein RN346_02715 [Halomonas sp. PAMB 3232]
MRCAETTSVLGRQRGAALVVVMVVLTGALMLGLVGVQSALVDQRQAANYRAALKAHMRAETAAARALSAVDTLDWHNAPRLEPGQNARWPVVTAHPTAVHRCVEGSCLYLPVMRGAERWVLALGVSRASNGALAAHSAPILLRVDEEREPGATFSWD